MRRGDWIAAVRGPALAAFALTVGACSFVLPTSDDLAGGVRPRISDDGALDGAADAPVSRCPIGTAECPGGCVDVRSDRQSCGACGRACGAEQTCASGRCARARYIAPSGDDSNAGTETSPWRTFAHAIPLLSPGDALFLLDGIYEEPTTGLPNADCTSKAKKGTPDAAIGILALNERKAVLRFDGSLQGLTMGACDHWWVDGITIAQAGSAQFAVRINGARNVELRRLLITGSSGLSSGGMWLENTSQSLVEENELYRFDGEAIRIEGDTNVVRRNYLRGGGPRTSSVGIRALGSWNTIENNIVENVNTGLQTNAAIGNAFRGNIVVDAGLGLILAATGNTTESMPRDTIVENALFLRTSTGFYARAAKNTRVAGCTAIEPWQEGENAAFAADAQQVAPGDGDSSIEILGSLALRNAHGFSFDNVIKFSVSDSNAFDQSVDSYWPPTTSAGYENALSEDPVLGACRVLIPETSPMKRRRAVGGDIGATIVYRIENGATTTQPLWDAAHGYRFVGCGAIVPNVNDSPDAACANASKRLGVGKDNGCPMPY